ncbi:hypothetical protein Plhal304r1_c061g0148211 [Plasmopara halstedii]
MVFFARRCRVCEVVNYVRAVHGLPKHPVDNDGRISDLYVTVYYVVHEDADMQGLVDEDDDDAAAGTLCLSSSKYRRQSRCGSN